MLTTILQAIIALGGIIGTIALIFKRSASKDAATARQKVHEKMEELRKTGRPSE